MDEMDLKFEVIYCDITKYITKFDDLILIRKAYEYAKEKHKGVLRKDGSPTSSYEVIGVISEILVKDGFTNVLREFLYK